jgi:hypothetical protein
MGDFVETNNARTSVRDLAIPIPDLTTFDAIVQDVITSNPFGCTDYVDGEATVPGVVRNREYYTVRVIYEDDDAKAVGNISARAPDIAGFDATSLELLGNAALSVAMSGTAVRDYARDGYYCQLRCHDAGGEIYYVTFTRKNVRISSYQDDTIRTAVETWADSVPALA